MERNLEQLVVDYGLTKEEAFALALAFIYLELAEHYFPDYKHYGLPSKGDPRKCELFRYCWKLRNETKEKLDQEEYRLYIRAQLCIMRNIKIGDEHPFIHPNCLVSKSSWARWQVWKKWVEHVNVKEEPKVNKNHIKDALQYTHYALKLRLGEITADKVLTEMPFILHLANMHVVSPWFIALSTTARKWLKDNKKAFDLKTLDAHTTTEIVHCYHELFGEI